MASERASAAQKISTKSTETSPIDDARKLQLENYDRAVLRMNAPAARDVAIVSGDIDARLDEALRDAPAQTLVRIVEPAGPAGEWFHVSPKRMQELGGAIREIGDAKTVSCSIDYGVQPRKFRRADWRANSCMGPGPNSH